MVELLRPIQARHAELAADPTALGELLTKGADRARAVAEVTLARAQDGRRPALTGEHATRRAQSSSAALRAARDASAPGSTRPPGRWCSRAQADGERVAAGQLQEVAADLVVVEVEADLAGRSPVLRQVVAISGPATLADSVATTRP